MYFLDSVVSKNAIVQPKTVTRLLFDGVLKGDYSLAVVNRELASALVAEGFDVSVHTSEEGWQKDALLNANRSVRARCLAQYPTPHAYDIHLRNIWPPRCDDMIGGKLNAYVCFAWEEMEFPAQYVDEFNRHLDLVLVTSRFVESALRQSGVTVPVYTVGNGTDHLGGLRAPPWQLLRPRKRRRRVLHVSSCFPRKGADLLVRAFTQTFSHSDDVELVIKTFDNPHNRIRDEVAAAQQAHPLCAPISVISESLSTEALRVLIRTADVLVAPSRGEGFGLPLAEAMLLGVPVVTTGYSGQTDFCTDETAWLVNYKLVPSSAHVSGAQGVWAEADVDHLGVMIRTALESRTASASKTAAAQSLLKKSFKWSDVARRVAAAISLTQHPTPGDVTTLPGLKRLLPGSVAVVSTWAQVCGIATYSQHLYSTSALGDKVDRVFARELRSDRVSVEMPVSWPDLLVTRPWGYDLAAVQRLAAELAADKHPVLWFQHHSGFFSDADMRLLVTAARRLPGRLLVISLHNTREVLGGGRGAWLRDVDLVFVHNALDVELITTEWPGIDVRVLPHGLVTTTEKHYPDPEQFTVGTFGFLLPHKNVPLLVAGFARALRIDQRFRLKLLCCVRNEDASQSEALAVRSLIRSLGIEHAVQLETGFLSDEEILNGLQRCDLLCFPYGHSDESTTGAVRIALAADRPILCSESPVLRDVRPYSLILPDLNAEKIAEALLMLAGSRTLMTAFDQRRHEFTRQFSYETIAQRYLQAIEDKVSV